MHLGFFLIYLIKFLVSPEKYVYTVKQKRASDWIEVTDSHQPVKLLAHSLGLGDPAFLLQNKGLIFMDTCWAPHLAIAVISPQLSFFSTTDTAKMGTTAQHISQSNQDSQT